MPFCCVGWYGHRNCGDDALQLAIKTLFPDSEFLYSQPSPEANIVLGGGDVIYPTYLNLIGNRKFKILGAGLGYQDQINLLSPNNIVDAFFRNKADVELAVQRGIKSQYTPDLAFALDVPKRDPILKRGDKKLLGIMVADTHNASIDGKHPKLLNYAEFFKWEIAESLKYLSEWYDLVFIPMSHYRYHYDIRMIYDIESRTPCKSAPIIFSEPCDPLTTLKIVSELDLLITMRFHGLIFATLAGTPFVNIGISRKTQLYCQEHRLDDLTLVPYSMEYDRFKDIVKNAEAEGVKERLLAIRDEKKNQLKVVQKYILENW